MDPKSYNIFKIISDDIKKINEDIKTEFKRKPLNDIITEKQTTLNNSRIGVDKKYTIGQLLTALLYIDLKIS